MARSSINPTLIGLLFKYRRPNLQYSSGTVVHVEDQIVTGVGGDVTALFPDGKFLTVNSATQTDFNITRVASLSGTKQSGLRTGAVADNTWYALYLVRCTDNDNTFVTVGDVVFPVNSGINTINANFGAGKWIYLGLIRNGNNVETNRGILQFTQVGNRTYLYGASNVNVTFGTGINGVNIVNAVAASANYTVAFGSTGILVPSNLDVVMLQCGMQGTATSASFNANTGARYAAWNSTASGFFARQIIDFPVGMGGFTLQNTGGGSVGIEVNIVGWVDNALGVGLNPLV